MTEAEFAGHIPARSGIYVIRHNATVSVYVGQSLNIRGRLGQHYEALVAGTHYNKPLQHLWSTHPPESFSALVQMLCPQGLSPLARQRWLVKAERQAIQTLKNGHTVLNRIDPEIVETPDSLAEFLELKALQDKAKEAKDKENTNTISRERREIKKRLEQLNQLLAPLRIQRGSCSNDITQREAILRKSKGFISLLFGRPTAEPIAKQEAQLTTLRNRLRELEAVLSPGEQECSRLKEEYQRLYSRFPNVQRQIYKRISNKTSWIYPSRKKPTITED